MQDDTADRLRRLAAALERVGETTGVLVGWLTLPMAVATFVIVVLRYAFGVGWIWMQEGVLWMHAAVFMLGAAYTLKHAAHVRVDVFYNRLSVRGRALVDILGTVFLLVPMTAFIVAVSWDYVAVAWQIREGSRESGGLPYPFVPLLKSIIPLTGGLLLVQAFAMLAANVPRVFTRGTSSAPPRAAGP